MTTKIYTLTDPNTNKVRYVGKSNNPKLRYNKHCVLSNKNTHKNNWINKLLKENKKPILDIIDEVPIENWVFWETYWISQFKTWGFNLVNNTNGGDGCTFGNQTSFKKGQKSWNKGIAKTAQAKEHLRKINLGKKYSDEIKKARSERTKGKPPTNINDFINGGEKTRFKKGQKPWNKGASGIIATGNKKAKEVLQFDFNGNLINEYRSYREASKLTNISEEGIRNCCNGKVNKCGGFKWGWKII